MALSGVWQEKLYLSVILDLYDLSPVAWVTKEAARFTSFGSPIGIIADTLILPSVNVPVLSKHKTSTRANISMQ